MKIHQIKIDFHVTEQISRFVYVYLLEADSLYLIDSGVFGCEKQIMDYLDSIGRDISDIKGIFLTHAHPDRVIIIQFPSREKLTDCYASDEYRQIMHERADSVDARALIVEE